MLRVEKDESPLNTQSQQLPVSPAKISNGHLYQVHSVSLKNRLKNFFSLIFNKIGSIFSSIHDLWGKIFNREKKIEIIQDIQRPEDQRTQNINLSQLSPSSTNHRHDTHSTEVEEEILPQSQNSSPSTFVSDSELEFNIPNSSPFTKVEEETLSQSQNSSSSSSASDLDSEFKVNFPPDLNDLEPYGIKDLFPTLLKEDITKLIDVACDNITDDNQEKISENILALFKEITEAEEIEETDLTEHLLSLFQKPNSTYLKKIKEEVLGLLTEADLEKIILALQQKNINIAPFISNLFEFSPSDMPILECFAGLLITKQYIDSNSLWLLFNNDSYRSTVLETINDLQLQTLLDKNNKSNLDDIQKIEKVKLLMQVVVKLDLGWILIHQAIRDLSKALSLSPDDASEIKKEITLATLIYQIDQILRSFNSATDDPLDLQSNIHDILKQVYRDPHLYVNVCYKLGQSIPIEHMSMLMDLFINYPKCFTPFMYSILEGDNLDPEKVKAAFAAFWHYKFRLDQYPLVCPDKKIISYETGLATFLKYINKKEVYQIAFDTIPDFAWEEQSLSTLYLENIMQDLILGKRCWSDKTRDYVECDVDLSKEDKEKVWNNLTHEKAKLLQDILTKGSGRLSVYKIDSKDYKETDLDKYLIKSS